MDAIKEYLRAVDRLEHNEINLSEYEELCKPLHDVRENLHGEWKTYKPLDEDGNIINGLGSIFRCSICGEEVLFEPCNYCPNCGTRMDGGK